MGMWLIQKPGPGKILKLKKKSHGKNMTFGSGEMQSHGVPLRTDAKNPTHDPFIPISIIYRLMANKSHGIGIQQSASRNGHFCEKCVEIYIHDDIMAVEINKLLQGMVLLYTD